METKICKQCEVDKEITEYYTQNSKPVSRCKVCIKEKVKEYRDDNKEVVKKQKQNYYQNNKEHCNNKGKIYRENNKEQLKEYFRKYRENNSEDIKDYCKEYYLNNKEKIISNVSEYRRNRKKNDNVYRFSLSIRRLINNSINRHNYTKRSKTCEILGCSYKEFKIHIESKFEDWMGWDNRGLYNGEFNYGWDIDHIIPLSSAKTEEDILKLNHFSNLQPLCSKINRDIKINN